MIKFFNICACEEELNYLKGMKLIGIENVESNGEDSGVNLTFEGDSGEITSIHLDENGELYRSPVIQPLYCAQDLRSLQGYTIDRVESDENDLDSRVYLVNSEGHTVVLLPDKALDGETLFFEE